MTLSDLPAQIVQHEIVISMEYSLPIADRRHAASEPRIADFEAFPPSAERGEIASDDEIRRQLLARTSGG
jgi:hypothetical protein